VTLKYGSAAQVRSLKPPTYKAALASHEAAKWKKAINKEVDALLKNKTWKRVKRPDPKLGIRVL
jgi:hypothetical protein